MCAAEAEFRTVCGGTHTHTHAYTHTQTHIHTQTHPDTHTPEICAAEAEFRTVFWSHVAIGKFN